MRRYPAYRDSGVEWLGEVPEGWELSRLGACFSERREKVSDKDFPALSVTMNGIVPQIETAAKTDDGDNRRLVRAGDFVINSRSDRKGSSGLSMLDGSVSLISIVITPRRQIYGPFSNWLLKSRAFQEEFYRWGSGIVADLWTTRYGDMSSITLALPPLPEQTAIAAFLDGETAKIDALVAEQRRLIDLLREKRQAVISHAVTKGLNPNAPLKPSGIDWLGDVPEGWEVLPLKRVTLERCDGPFGSGLKSEHYVEAGMRVVRLQNIKADGFSDDDAAFIDLDYASSELSRHTVLAGDVLIAGLGDERNLVGRACVAPVGIEPAMVKADCFRFRLNTSRAASDFVALQLNVSAAFDAGTKATGTTRSRIPLSQMAERALALPPLAEQHEIDGHVQRVSYGFDTLTATAETAIALLQERRAALISAAVTGKIDVRHLVQKEDEAA